MRKKIAVTVLVLAILAASLLAFAGCTNTDYKIAVMDNSEHMASDEVMRSFRDTLDSLMKESGKKVSYVYTKSGGADDEEIAKSEEGKAAKVKKKKADIVLALTQSSSTAAQQFLSDIPTVFAQAAIADRNLQEDALRVQVEKQIDLMKLIAPESTSLGILFCTTDTLDADGNVTKTAENKTKAEINQDLQVKIAKQYIESLGLKAEIYMYNKNDEKTHDTFVKDGLNELKGKGVGCVFMPVDNTLASATNGPKIHERANTNIYTKKNGIAAREVASMPIVCGDIKMNGYFGVATYAYDYTELGAQAAREVFNILVNGKDVKYSEFKTDFSKGKYVINEKVASDIGFEIPQSVKELAA